MEIVQAMPAFQPLTFALNEPLAPLEDDMGAVDNVFFGHLGQQPVIPMDEDVFVASSDSEGAVEEPPAPVDPQPVVPDVNVFVPMEDGIPLQLIPDEVQEEQLLGQPKL